MRSTYVIFGVYDAFKLLLLLTATLWDVITPRDFVWIIANDTLNYFRTDQPKASTTCKGCVATKMICTYYFVAIGWCAWILTEPHRCCDKKKMKKMCYCNYKRINSRV